MISKIICESMKEFVAVVALLTERGIGFNAYAYNLTIELTGAY